MVPVDKKLVNAMEKLDMSHNQEAQKIVAEANRKSNVSVTGRETILPELIYSWLQERVSGLAVIMLHDDIPIENHKA